MRVPTRAHLLGYPAVAMIGYLTAVIAAVYLIASTLIRDRKDQERAKMKGR
jgi:hypothetical protein